MFRAKAPLFFPFIPALQDGAMKMHLKDLPYYG
jgi:hypothetical protein